MLGVIIILAILLVLLLALLSFGAWASGSWTRAAAGMRNAKSGTDPDVENRAPVSPEILVTLETHLPAWVAVSEDGAPPRSMSWPAVVYAQSPAGSVTMRRANATVTMEAPADFGEDDDAQDDLDGKMTTELDSSASRQVRRAVTLDAVSIPADTIVVSVTLVSADDFNPGDSGCDLSYVAQAALNETLPVSGGTITLPPAVLSVDGGHGPIRTLRLAPSVFAPRSPATLVVALSRKRRGRPSAATTTTSTSQVQLRVLAREVRLQLPRGTQTLLAYVRVPSARADKCGFCPSEQAPSPSKGKTEEGGDEETVHTVLAMEAMSVAPLSQTERAKHNMDREVDRQDHTLAPPERSLVRVVDEGRSSSTVDGHTTLRLAPWAATLRREANDAVIVEMPAARLWRQIISHETSYAEADLKDGSTVTFTCMGRVVLASPPSAIRVVCQASRRGPSVLMAASEKTQWNFLLFPFGKSPSRKLGLVVGRAADGEVFAAQAPHGHVHWPPEAAGSKAVAGQVTFA